MNLNMYLKVRSDKVLLNCIDNYYLSVIIFFCGSLKFSCARSATGWQRCSFEITLFQWSSLIGNVLILKPLKVSLFNVFRFLYSISILYGSIWIDIHSFKEKVFYRKILFQTLRLNYFSLNIQVRTVKLRYNWHCYNAINGYSKKMAKDIIKKILDQTKGDFISLLSQYFEPIQMLNILLLYCCCVVIVLLLCPISVIWKGGQNIFCLWRG